MDINKILRISNLMVLIISIIIFITNGFNTLVNFDSIQLLIALTLQVEFFLLLEEKKRNPLVILTCFNIIFFYSTRLVTLINQDLFGFSGALDRLSYPTADDINNALIYILIANIFIFFGLIFGNNYKSNKDNVIFNKIKIPEKKIIILTGLLTLILYNFDFEFNDRFSGIFKILIEPSNLYFIILSSIFFGVKDIRLDLILILMLITWLLSILFGGARSGLFIGFQLILISHLSSHKFNINFRFIILGFSLLTLSILLFPIISQLRMYRANEIDILLIDKILNLNFNILNISEYNNMFNRIGYLDFTVEMIKNKVVYSTNVNIVSIIKSLFDSLTPGFDIFDQPKMANVLSGIYYGESDRFLRVNYSNYQSDQFGIYGEYYLLFGEYFSLPVLFIISYIFSKAFFYFKNINFYTFILKSSILVSFIMLLSSYGIDWLIIYTFFNILSLFLFLLFFIKIKI